MAALAKVASVTWLRRVNRHAHTGFLDDAGKLVAECQRRFELGVADASIQIGVQVAAADTGRLDADEDFVRCRQRDFLDAHVARAMQPGGKHQRFPKPGARW